MKIEAWDDFLLTKSFWNIILKFNSLQKCVQFSDGLEINIILFFFFLHGNDFQFCSSTFNTALKRNHYAGLDTNILLMANLKKRQTHKQNIWLKLVLKRSMKKHKFVDACANKLIFLVSI